MKYYYISSWAAFLSEARNYLLRSETFPKMMSKFDFIYAHDIISCLIITETANDSSKTLRNNLLNLHWKASLILMIQFFTMEDLRKRSFRLSSKASVEYIQFQFLFRKARGLDWSICQAKVCVVGCWCILDGWNYKAQYHKGKWCRFRCFREYCDNPLHHYRWSLWRFHCWSTRVEVHLFCRVLKFN